MDMNKDNIGLPQELVISLGRYKNEDEMWSDIASALRIITKNGNIATFRCDESGLGIYVIEYNRRDPGFGGEYPYWMTEDDYCRAMACLDDERNGLKGERDAE